MTRIYARAIKYNCETTCEDRTAKLRTLGVVGLNIHLLVEYEIKSFCFARSHQICVHVDCWDILDQHHFCLYHPSGGIRHDADHHHIFHDLQDEDGVGLEYYLVVEVGTYPPNMPSDHHLEVPSVAYRLPVDGRRVVVVDQKTNLVLLLLFVLEVQCVVVVVHFEIDSVVPRNQEIDDSDLYVPTD